MKELVKGEKWYTIEEMASITGLSESLLRSCDSPMQKLNFDPEIYVRRESVAEHRSFKYYPEKVLNALLDFCKQKMEIWIVEYVMRDKNGYAYEVETWNNVFATEEEANQFFEDLPKWIDKYWPEYYVLENRYPPKKIGPICHYDRKQMKITIK